MNRFGPLNGAATKPSGARSFRYPYEEFTDHIKAMPIVRQWEDTSRFGHLGSDQTTRANNARLLEYFSDSYTDLKEAVQKAELFMSIYDYIGRHKPLFARKDMIEEFEGDRLTVEPALLRAVHHVFTAADSPAGTDPRQVLALARAFQEIEPRV